MFWLLDAWLDRLKLTFECQYLYIQLSFGLLTLMWPAKHQLCCGRENRLGLLGLHLFCLKRRCLTLKVNLYKDWFLNVCSNNPNNPNNPSQSFPNLSMPSAHKQKIDIPPRTICWKVGTDFYKGCTGNWCLQESNFKAVKGMEKTRSSKKLKVLFCPLCQKNPRAHKNKIGPPPPQNPKYPPPPLKRGILWTGGFSCRKNAIFPRVRKIGAAISGPRIADTNFTDTRIFLIVKRDLGFPQCSQQLQGFTHSSKPEQNRDKPTTKRGEGLYCPPKKDYPPEIDFLN